jgi:hypothetical protein
MSTLHLPRKDCFHPPMKRVPHSGAQLFARRDRGSQPRPLLAWWGGEWGSFRTGSQTPGAPFRCAAFRAPGPGSPPRPLLAWWGGEWGSFRTGSQTPGAPLWCAAFRAPGPGSPPRPLLAWWGGEWGSFRTGTDSGAPHPFLSALFDRKGWETANLDKLPATATHRRHVSASRLVNHDARNRTQPGSLYRQTWSPACKNHPHPQKLATARFTPQQVEDAHRYPNINTNRLWIHPKVTPLVPF